jgi:crotonobetainyl-CoA:carnitine CoA-transferase CaiB-like acyl-CoA transferase
MADIFGDPHYAARGAIARAPDEELGEVAMAAPVPRLSQTPAAIRHAGRRIGEDTRRVLHELLGMGDAEIARLEAAGVVACDRGSRESIGERAGAA